MRTVLFCVLLGSTIQASSQCTPVSSFDFNGNANDNVGPNNGTLFGSPVDSTNRDGLANSSFYFDGVDDYIHVPQDFDYPEKTISLWFKASTIPSAFTAYIFTTDNDLLAYGLNMAVVTEIGGVDYLRFQTGVISTHSYDYPISENTWYHLAMVFTTTDVKYYVNCMLVATQTASNVYSTINPGDPGTLFGCDRVYNRFLTGFIDDVSIYNCALSDLNICSIYNSTAEEHANQIDMNIYPNPITIGSNLNLSLDLSTNYKYVIYSNTGQLVTQGDLISKGDVFIHPSLFIPGVYTIEVTDKNGLVARRRFIVAL